VAFLAVFTHYECVINGTIFEKKNVVERTMCGLVFSTNFTETHLILRRTERHDHECTLCLHVHCRLLFLTDFNEI